MCSKTNGRDRTRTYDLADVNRALSPAELLALTRYIIAAQPEECNFGSRLLFLSEDGIIGFSTEQMETRHRRMLTSERDVSGLCKTGVPLWHSFLFSL